MSQGTSHLPDQVGAAPVRMTGRQRVVLLLLLGATFLLAVDFSILNVAIPVIGERLGFTVDALPWIATAFAIMAAGFTLLFGRVADLYGRRRLLLLGMALLVAASLLGGLAGSPAVVIAARALQGLATAMVIPAALSLLTTTFPEGPLRARALGLHGALIAAGFTVGAVLGGVLVGLLSWRWTFLINIPVGLLILVLAPVLLPESRAGDRPRLDIPGAITVSTGLGSLVFAVSTAGHAGWADPLVLGFLGLAVVLLVAFWRIELRAPSPLAPVRILRRTSVRWGNLGGLLAIAGQSAVAFLITIYLQRVLGYSALATGLTFAVFGVVSAIAGAVVAPRLVNRFGARSALAGGMAVQAAATACLFFAGETRASLALVLIAGSAGAFGHLVAVVSYMVTATSGLPDDVQGLATGLATLTQQVALAVGIPVMATVVAARVHALATVEPASAALVQGLGAALLVDAALVAAGALLVALFLRRPSAAGAPAGPAPGASAGMAPGLAAGLASGPGDGPAADLVDDLVAGPVDGSGARPGAGHGNRA